MVKLAAGQKNSGYHVRVVDRVFAILEELADGSARFGDVALAEKLGLHKSTVHRLLAVMQQNGLSSASRAARSTGWAGGFLS